MSELIDSLRREANSWGSNTHESMTLHEVIDYTEKLEAKLTEISEWKSRRLSGYKGVEHPAFCGCGECRQCLWDCALDDIGDELSAIINKGKSDE